MSRLRKKHLIIFTLCLVASGYIDGMEKKKYSPKATKELIIAVEGGDLEAAKAAFEQGGDPNAQLPIFLPGMQGLRELPRFYLKFGFNLLEYAIATGNLPMARFLARHATFNPHKFEKLGLGNLLNLAVQSGNLDMVQWVLGEGAEVLAPSGFYRDRPIDMALIYGHPHLISYLRSQGAYIPGGPRDLIAQIIEESLRVGRTEESIIESVELALENGYDINAPLLRLFRPLVLGIEAGLNNLVQLLVEQGATLTNSVRKILKDKNIKSIFNNTLLDAIAFGYKDTVLVLLAELKSKEKLSNSEILLIRRALNLASAQGFEEIVVELLAHFSNYLNRETIGRSLYLATRNGHLNVVQDLFESQSGSIQHNSLDWRPYLARALRAAILRSQTNSEILSFFLTNDFLYNLGIPIDAVDQIRDMVNDPHITMENRQYLEELLATLTRHQRAVGLREAELLAQQETSLIRTLPESVLSRVVGYLH